MEANHSSYGGGGVGGIGESGAGAAGAGKPGNEHEKSRSRTRVGVTTGQIAIGTPSYSFKSKMNLVGTGPAQASGLQTLNILNQKSLHDGKDSSLSQRAGGPPPHLPPSDSMKENLINIDLTKTGKDIGPLKPQDMNNNGYNASATLVSSSSPM